MKPTDISDALNDVDPAYVKSSEPGAAQKKRFSGRFVARFAAAAAALAIVIGVGAAIARRGGGEKPPAVPAGSAAQDPGETAPTATGAQTQQDGDGAAQALLKLFTAYAAEYPAQTPYPAKGDLAEQSEIDAWYEAAQARRKYYGAGRSLTSFFTASLPAFLGGEEGQNSVCSPLNIYFALAMLAEISDGNTRQQVLSLIGAADIETLRTQANRVFNANYRNDGSADCILASSLWLNENVSFRSDTLKTLAEQYYASTYRGQPGTEDFDAAIQAWVNEQTGDLLQDMASGIQTGPLDYLDLFTTAYFGDKWQIPFNTEETERGVFHGPDGDTEADFMRATDFWGKYYWGERFGAVKKDLQQQGSVWFILPDEGTSPEELLGDGEAPDFLFTQNKEADWQNVKSLKVHFSLPRFDVSSCRSLKEGLKELGVTDCFTEDADFSPLTDDGPVALSDVRHGARVTADEQGVTAAAYTEMTLAGAAMPPEDEMDFTLDRPFIFAVMSDDQMPLFVGIVNRP
ncbi:MAG: hypothetical protein K6C36_04785 [Clostridia bacterium]|nr:hypothetical protein [Clostridia bacterium]